MFYNKGIFMFVFSYKLRIVVEFTIRHKTTNAIFLSSNINHGKI